MADPPKSIPVTFFNPDTGERTLVGTAVVDPKTGEAVVQITDHGVARLVGDDEMRFSIKDEE